MIYAVRNMETLPGYDVCVPTERTELHCLQNEPN